jgi:hypothetical protein
MRYKADISGIALPTHFDTSCLVCQPDSDKDWQRSPDRELYQCNERRFQFVVRQLRRDEELNCSIDCRTIKREKNLSSSFCSSQDPY